MTLCSTRRYEHVLACCRPTRASNWWRRLGAARALSAYLTTRWCTPVRTRNPRYPACAAHAPHSVVALQVYKYYMDIYIYIYIYTKMNIDFHSSCMHRCLEEGKHQHVMNAYSQSQENKYTSPCSCIIASAVPNIMYVCICLYVYVYIYIFMVYIPMYQM
jgi:hypothetical protein